MRKVEYCQTGFYGGVGKSEPKDFKEGVFHGFFSEGDNEQGITTYALTEIENGEVKCLQTHIYHFHYLPPLFSSSGFSLTIATPDLPGHTFDVQRK